MQSSEKLYNIPLEDIIGDRFGRYSKYIIQERALPDARDGLKPVQRRILYSMHVEGNTQDKPYRKSAKTVGNVIGNYHPHGDTSVYDAMVRLSQDWKLRNVLVQMHGNNGSIDGDPPAAMRYTEARLSAIASELLRDIDKETVDFVPNFDDTSMEPVVLPSMFPNLLVNGSTGISAGYATEIPSHHLGEVIDATIMRIENKNCTVDELMTVIHGPDFATGGIIQGVDGIKKAYETGKGKIIIRSRVHTEDLRGGKQALIITEIPSEVNKANLVKKMDEVRLDRKVDGITEVRDETDRTGLRIVIELKKDANNEAILNYLYKNTELQIPYNFNMVAIYNRTPKQMSLPAILDAYIEHQKEVITNRSNFDLRKAKARQHVVEGLMKALSILDEVITTIRSANDKRDAKDKLIAQFEFTEQQAEAIVMLQLYRLTNTDITALQEEADELDKKIKQLEAILNSEAKLLSVIKTDLKKIKLKYADDRRSTIQEEIEEIKISREDIIAQEDVIVTVTSEGYVKRTSPRSYSASNGKDYGMKEGDRLIYQIESTTTDTLILFTSKGNYLYLPIHEMQDIRWKDMGQHVANIIPIERDEAILSATVVNNFEENKDYILFVTKNGIVKRTSIQQLKVQRYSKPLVGMSIKSDDSLIFAGVTSETDQVLLATSSGYTLLFNVEEISIQGLRAGGVKGINLKDHDFVVSADTISNEVKEIFCATHRGAIKKMKLDTIPQSSRGTRGVKVLRDLKNNPHLLIGVYAINENDMFVLLSKSGQFETVDPTDLRNSDQYSNGSFVMDTDDSGEIKTIIRYKKEENN
ncbi:DNA topoisomerase IV subunit A [Gottfriedia acidiceleris]|uniref:DNA topoisomerase IV subunit A n=1 Tax=Gottfriedia acidiceleris TaxID=371036 RepID=UPI003D1F6FD6